MIIDGIGMRGDGGHTVNETADIGMLPTQISRAAVIALSIERRVETVRLSVGDGPSGRSPAGS